MSVTEIDNEIEIELLKTEIDTKLKLNYLKRM